MSTLRGNSSTLGGNLATLGIVATQSNAGEIGLTTFRKTSKSLFTCTLSIIAECATFMLLHCSIIYFCFPTAAHVPIYTQDFSAHVEKLFANDKYGFSEEYKVIANNMF